MTVYLVSRRKVQDFSARIKKMLVMTAYLVSRRKVQVYLVRTKRKPAKIASPVNQLQMNNTMPLQHKLINKKVQVYSPIKRKAVVYLAKRKKSMPAVTIPRVKKSVRKSA